MGSLISLIPSIIFNIIVGYCFIYVFNMIVIIEDSEDIQNIILKSFIVGYIYCLIAYAIPFSVNEYIDNVCIIFSAIIVAYWLGRFYISKYMTKLLDRLHIQKSKNKYIWRQLLDRNYSMIARIEYSDKIYDGYIHEYQDFSNTPLIALCLYIVTDKDGNILKDRSTTANEVILLDTSKAISVQFLYDENSEITKDIRSFLPENLDTEKNNDIDNMKTTEEIKHVD